MSEIFLSNLQGVIDIQDAGVGRGNRGVLDVTQDVKYALSGLTKSMGNITRNYRVSPRTNSYVPRPVRREPPEAIEPSLACKMVAANYMEKFSEKSRFALYVRHVSSNPAIPLNYSRIDIINDVAVGAFEYGDFTIDEGSEEDITLTVPLNAAAHILVKPVAGKKLTSGWSNADDCNVVAGAVDADGVLYGVTAADGTGTHPFLVKSTDDGATWSEIELTDITAGGTAIAVAGDYLIIAAGTTLAVYEKDGTPSSTYTAAGAIAALCAIDAANLVAVGASGLVLASTDTGSTWTALTTGSANNLTSVMARNITEWYSGGASGTLLKYANGTLSTITLPAGPATASIDHIAFPTSPAGFSRDDDIYIGCSDGTVWRSIDGGTTWTQVSFPGDDAGTLAGIGFCEFLGQVFYVLHTPAGGSSLLYRDWSGGVGNPNMERVSVPTNSGMNALVVIDANNAYLFGDVHSTAEMVIKVEA